MWVITVRLINKVRSRAKRLKSFHLQKHVKKIPHVANGMFSVHFKKINKQTKQKSITLKGHPRIAESYSVILP